MHSFTISTLMCVLLMIGTLISAAEVNNLNNAKKPMQTEGSDQLSNVKPVGKEDEKSSLIDILKEAMNNTDR